MRVRVNFIYVTALLDGIDVMTRHYPARQHNVGAVSLHTPAMQACDRKPQLPASCSSGTVQSLYRRCTTSMPAVKGVYSVSHARRTSAAQDHPVYI